MKSAATLFLAILMLITTGCSRVSSIEKVETREVVIEYTIFQNYSSPKIKPLSFTLPMESYEVIELPNQAKLTSRKLEPAGDFSKSKDIFRYNDIEKYSLMEIDFGDNEDKPVSYYASQHIYEYPIKIKANIYVDEFEKLESDVFRVWRFMKYDYYNGGIEDNTFYDIKEEVIDSRAWQAGIITDGFNLHDEYISFSEENEEFKNISQQLAKETEGLPMEQKIKKVIEWIRGNIEYNRELGEPYYHTAKKTLEMKRAVCTGKAYLFTAFAKYLDIPSFVVYGKYVNEKIDMGHAWNIVVDNDEARVFYVDPTNDVIELDYRNVSNYKIYNPVTEKYGSFLIKYNDNGSINFAHY